MAGSDLPTDAEYADAFSFMLPDDGRGRIVVLKVTVDEAGTGYDDPVLCVAACVGSKRQWGLFVKEWRPIAARFPDGYHARQDQGGEASEILADLMYQRLDHTEVVSITDSEYKAHASHRFRSVVGSSYVLAVQALVWRLSKWAAWKNVRWLSYLLESGHRNQARVQRIFEHIHDNPQFKQQMRVWQHSWGGKQDLTLHPADLLSHQLATSGPLSQMLWERSHHGHIGPEETREVEGVVMPFYDHLRAKYRAERKAAKQARARRQQP